MTATETRPITPTPDPERRPGELNLRELLRWTWRQLTSMRTALILLLLLALAAVPGSVIPQSRVDSLKTGQWQDKHTTLTPIYNRLDLFNVYGSAWFAAIYLLLMVSLLGCIIPRTLVYLRGVGAPPPAAPRNLTRLRDHASYSTAQTPDQVLAQTRALLRKRRYRLRAVAEGDTFVGAERGYLREVGNLVFHLSVMLVLVGFAIGTLFGYKGGVILVQGDTFANTPTQYDDFLPGSLFSASKLDPFNFSIDHFGVQWLTSGPKAGMPRDFNADMTYRTSLDSPKQTYDLRVNHPLTIGKTEIFLIGEGYAPIVTIRDADGDSVYHGPSVFLPVSSDLFSFGVIKSSESQPSQLGFEGFFYPTYADIAGTPVNLTGKDSNPVLSLTAYAGNLGLDNGSAQSVYTLDKSGVKEVLGADGKALRINLQKGQTETLPNGLGSITFDGVQSWQRLQISQSPGKLLALGGVVLALIGLLGSLFVRSRRVWVRAVPSGSGSLVEVAVLDRSGGADTGAVLSELLTALQRGAPAPAENLADPRADPRADPSADPSFDPTADVPPTDPQHKEIS